MDIHLFGFIPALIITILVHIGAIAEIQSQQHYYFYTLLIVFFWLFVSFIGLLWGFRII